MQVGNDPVGFWLKLDTLGNIVIAFAVAWIAHRQYKLQKDTELLRLKERERDEATRLREWERNEFEERIRSYGIVRMEWYRLDSVADRWSEADLLAESAAYLLNPADFALRDWAGMAEHLARLGDRAALIGTYSLQRLEDANAGSKRLLAEVAAFRSSNDESDLVYSRWWSARLPAWREHEAAIKRKLREAVDLLGDALGTMPEASIPEYSDCTEPVYSETGRQLLAGLKRRKMGGERASPAGEATEEG